MKRYILPVLFTLVTMSAFAQIPEDVLKYSWTPINGTARINAVGGAMGSLGGDISATFVNPAGLGFFKTTDLVLSPGFNFAGNKGSFRGTTAKDNNSAFNFGPTGIVGGWTGANKWNNALSLAINRSANFSNRIYYTGKNDFSSFAEQYAAEAAASGVNINDMPFSTALSFGTRLASWNYAIDTASIPGHAGQDIVSMAMWDALKNGGEFLVNQSHTIETSGGITEIALGFGTNHNDKFYVGGTFGLPIVNYKKTSLLREEDATGNNNNNFRFNEISETFTTKGIGINGKIGMIFKPVEYIRVGLAVHTPTLYSFEDRYDAYMNTDLEQYRSTPGALRVNLSEILNNGESPVYKYELVTPWKFMLSGSYVLREVEDVRKQKGFVTADVEYVTYKSNKFQNAEDYDDHGYYDGVNSTMKSYYKNALNFRLGGELKFTTIMGRLGFAYYGNPYSDAALKASKMFISGGAGYRNAGMYIDLTYVYGIQKDVSFPYRLADKANTFANLRGNGSNISLTVGFKI